jgi:methyl-accepting chemotaxis protein
MKGRSAVNPAQSPRSEASGPDPGERIQQPRAVESAETPYCAELSDILQALERLAAGDTTVKIRETPGGDPLSQLRRAVNETGNNLAQIVDSAHELAIGLAEHFEVLRRDPTVLERSDELHDRNPCG